MSKPNFFIVGAPRSGTASMYAYLKQHPQIFTSVVKEPHFFGSDLSVQPHTIRDEKIYLELFEGSETTVRRGEASVWYLMSKKAAQEIRAFAPDAKILILLRNPVEMAYSLYSLYVRTGNEDLETFEQALDAEADRREGRRIPVAAYFPEGLLYTDVGRYSKMVERYLRTFGAENVQCILFDDFVRATAATYRRTLEFLGVDADFEAELDRRRAAQRVRMIAVRQLRRASSEVKRSLRFEGMKLHEAPPRSPLPADLYARVADLLADDRARLGELLGRDLGVWAPRQASAAGPRPGSQAS